MSYCNSMLVLAALDACVTPDLVAVDLFEGKGNFGIQLSCDNSILDFAADGIIPCWISFRVLELQNLIVLLYFLQFNFCIDQVVPGMIAALLAQVLIT